MRELLLLLARYAVHHHGCPGRAGYIPDASHCTCGLGKLLEDVKKELSK